MSAGLAKTDRFLLSTATVMVGPAADLLTLNVADHSIGLVKNFQMQSDPQLVELTQGMTNTPVMSVRINEGLRCSMEVYEYTVRNLGYAAGLNASGGTFSGTPYGAVWPTTANISANSNSATVTGNVLAGGGALANGQWVQIQRPDIDEVHIAQLSNVSSDGTNSTLTFAGFNTPANVVFTAGSWIRRVKDTQLGTQLAQANLAAKVVGLLPKDNRAFVILFPKIQVTKGISLTFNNENFNNMPFEFTPYSQLPGDPTYTQFGVSNAILYSS